MHTKHQDQKDNTVVTDKDTSLANEEVQAEAEALQEALREGVMDTDPIV